VCTCVSQTEQRLDSYTTAADNVSVYSTSLWRRLAAVTSFDDDVTSSPYDAILTTSQNVTSTLRRRAEEAWSAMRSRADIVNDADVILDEMRRRVTSSLTSLVTSQGIRAAVNTTLNDLQPSDISLELMTLGTVAKMC